MCGNNSDLRFKRLVVKTKHINVGTDKEKVCKFSEGSFNLSIGRTDWVFLCTFI